MSVYKDYPWLPWKFNVLPRGHFQSKENQKKYMIWLSKKLNINSMEDWYSKSSKVKKFLGIFRYIN